MSTSSSKAMMVDGPASAGTVTAVSPLGTTLGFHGSLGSVAVTRKVQEPGGIESAIIAPSKVPRKIRVEYPRAIYRVMSRGDRCEEIFLDDVDRQDFLKILAEACQKTGFQIHAYCLMRNHFHLVVETPNGNLVPGMAGR